MDAPEDDQTPIGIQHPLENHLIQDRVLDHFQPLATFDGWKRFRAVCKSWYLLTLSKWRASAFLNLKIGPTLHKNIPGGSVVSIPEYLTLMENENNSFYQFTEIPFQKYKLHNLMLYVFYVKKNSLFWTSIGPNIRHLSLHEVDIRTVTNAMNEVMEFLVNQTRNLESFHVSNVYIGGKRIGKPPRVTVVHPHVKTLSISNCFAFGFANFPNLQELNLNSCASKDATNLAESNFSVVQGRPNTFLTNSSIQQLRLVNCIMNAEELPYLQLKAIKHLSISRDTDIRYIDLSVFLMVHSPTLKTIEAIGNPIKPSFGCAFTRNTLPNLTELRAWGNVLRDLSIICYTPDLKVLHLDLYGFEKQEEMKEMLKTSSSDNEHRLIKRNLVKLTKEFVGFEPVSWQYLYYFQINYELSQNSLKALAKWMPYLKTFKTILNQDTFSVVCEKWPELEHLECLFGSSILNKNITGTGVSKNALTDIEYLTTFKLYTECNKSLLSDDDSVSMGFLRVPKLTDLSICVSPEFSQNAEILLRRGIRNVQLYRNYSSNPLHNNWQCCRDKEYKSWISRQ